MVYEKKRSLWYIAIIVEWLNGNYDKENTPYTLHDKEYQYPSWWNLLYAMAKRVGGKGYRLVEKIAKNKG